MSLQYFKNTSFIDVLELLKLVKIPELHNLPNKNGEQGLCGSDNESFDSAEHDNFSITIDKVETHPNKNKAEYDPFLVTWRGPNDPEFPMNWPSTRKTLTVIQVMLLTCVNYMGSSIYTPGENQIRDEFKIGHVTATLNLSLYILGYGIGPLLFSPLSELSKIGRLPIYTITFIMFFVFNIGIATVHNIGGMIVMRFITGILCSPPLSTGGATIGDIIAPEKIHLYIGIWSVGTMVAPIIGPLLGASMVVAKGWRWIFWLLVFLSAFTFVFTFFFFQETSHKAILSRRARRIRKQTGDDRYYSIHDREDEQVKTKTIVKNTLVRPFEMIAKEPIILAFDLYSGLAYGAFYLFFESFPIVFVNVYHFTLIELGLSYLGFCVGCFLAFVLLGVFQMKYLKQKFEDKTFVPEDLLVVLLLVFWAFPASLFLFGWAASTHWIVPIIAQVLFVICCWNLFQVTYAYLALSFPNYVASVFAGNGLFRAGFACSFPLFGRAMYNNLAIDSYPVGWGSTIVGFVALALSVVPFVLHKYGHILRAKSRFA
ncbi:similar to Saccharomyces cerevisiae YBR008C FLR1 Plasma membrane multidrug transporter of the major facilitator superfamily [Maudiozyma saulgeensis]|uniref:Similar to Saccharomyces cerevisiae YBR008C FLR1 Plasma membrane multidrug transporter of the major facilitator superfamily n=1 Tax=Maudiozyma saulgeensis TaxID=1789683 RepID=A0A1X7R4L1_9SACH|nr:similar to Saccharomyces cerevisiae YBR008C FLR1 Plasma membrane multidrug transporter of the major facilitator superfamily [Kazachstania saulgeensis]